MAEEKPRTRTVAYYLFGETATQPEQAFHDKVDQTMLQTGATGEDEDKYALYVENKPEHETGWANDLARAIGRDEIGATTSSASAALAFQVRDDDDEKLRIMAATWGPAGRHFLNLDLLEDGYGMKTAMNLIDPDAVRSKDSRSFDDSVKQRRMQSSRLTSFDEFDFDPMQEILDHVTGRVLARYDGFATRISGSYYLQIRAAMEPSQIFDKARRSLGHYHRDDYLQTFPWVKNKRGVSNPREVAKLDELVVAQLQTGAATNFHLAAPTIVDWDRIEGFIHKGLRHASLTPDLHLADYLARVKPSEITAESLRSDTVRVAYMDGAQPEQWPIYRSLVAEVDDEDHKYILSAGRWFSLDQDWVNDIETQLVDINVHDPLPAASAHDEKEDEYNKRAAGDLAAVLMDKVPLRPSNAASNVELCDILTDDLEFIHVKKRESSATLSHLYMQGSVSAQAVTSDETYRQKAGDAIRGQNPDFGALDTWDTLLPSKMEVVYAVMAEDRFKGKENLPFFSKVSLCQTAGFLRRLNFTVSYADILRPGKPSP